MLVVANALETRRALLADLDALLAHVQAGFDSYVEFAPVGWHPPSVPSDRDLTIELLSDSETWALLGLVEHRPVGHVAFLPGRQLEPDDRRRWNERPKIPGLAHLWQLFVLPQWWGRSVAATLHDAAVTEMAARGFDQARLYTPTLHIRARRFYERRGWTPGEEQWNRTLQLVVSEYRRPILPRRSRS